MKKLLLKLLGDSFIKALIIQVGNKLLSKFIPFVIKEAHKVFGNRPVWVDISNFLIGLSFEKFFKEPETVEHVEKICQECKHLENV